MYTYSGYVCFSFITVIRKIVYKIYFIIYAQNREPRSLHNRHVSETISARAKIFTRR